MGFETTFGLQEVYASLRGGGGPEPSGDLFFRLLGIPADSPLEISPSESAWQWSRVMLFSVSMKEVSDAEEPSEAFVEAVKVGFARASSILSSCDKAGLDRWRASGKEADVFIGGWLANQQFDLAIAAEFLSQCARLGLSIDICTND